MPARIPTINLLPDSSFDNTPFGRITAWAVTYGRYIMIGTEIVVLLAFISRFSLDRKLTDLKEEISQKQAILQANSDFEKQFKGVQDRLSKIRTLVATQGQPSDMVNLLQSVLPADVYLDAFDMRDGKLLISAIAGTTEGFSQFLTNVQSNPDVTQIDVGDVNKQPTLGIQFKLTIQVKQKRAVTN